MFQTNQYFDGKVKSIAYKGNEGKSTVGVMAKGEYEFTTSSQEEITVLSGSMHTMLPNATSWQVYKPYESFKVEADSKFRVKVEDDTSYKSVYKIVQDKHV